MLTEVFDFFDQALLIKGGGVKKKIDVGDIMYHRECTCDHRLERRLFGHGLIKIAGLTNGQAKHEEERRNNHRHNEETGEKGAHPPMATHHPLQEMVGTLEERSENSSCHDSRKERLKNEKDSGRYRKKNKKEKEDVKGFELHT